MKKETDGTLTSLQKQAIAVLSEEGLPLKDAAAAVGVSAVTLLRWKSQPPFRRALDEAVRGRLSDAASGALRTVTEIMKNADSDNVRLCQRPFGSGGV